MKFNILFFFVSVIVMMAGLISPPVHPVEQLFHRQMDSAISTLKTFHHAVNKNEPVILLKKNFLNSRLAYKKASVLVDYFFPGQRKSINGPDLKYAEEDNPDNILDPHGFQVIERILYSDSETGYMELEQEALLLVKIFEVINEQPELNYKLRNELVFDALRSADIRLVALGITGFDSPIAQHSLDETAAVLAGMKDILLLYDDNKIIRRIDDSQAYLHDNPGFNDFDRMEFIKKFADPLYSDLLGISTRMGYILPEERRPVNQRSAGIFSANLFDLSFFSPNQRYRSTPERVALGRFLFYDSILSNNNNRSCSSCHHPEKAFSDGLRNPIGFAGTAGSKRNTPTLTGVAYQTRFFYDSRSSTLENQLNSVVHNANEMDGSLRQSMGRIRDNGHYSGLFKKAYPNDDEAVSEYNISNAISSYIRSLPTFTSKFDRYMKGLAAMTGKEIDGFNLFAGKAKCATCHYLPLFNGLVPPQFVETESEVLGVPESADTTPFKLDPDEGKYLFTRSIVNKYAFKTPTLRNIALTAPYMHNGAYVSLEQVVDFYNEGGGAGLHIAPINQTLPPDELHLTKNEKRKLIAFLKTLTDQ